MYHVHITPPRVAQRSALSPHPTPYITPPPLNPLYITQGGYLWRNRKKLPTGGVIYTVTYSICWLHLFRRQSKSGPFPSLTLNTWQHDRFESLVPSSKVVGSSLIQRTRGSLITLRSETRISSCSALEVDEALGSFSWSLVAANESLAAAPHVFVEAGRDPRVLVLPPHTLGFAGSSYQFLFNTTFGGETATANATGGFPKLAEFPQCTSI